MADDRTQRSSKSKRILGGIAIIIAICLLAVILIPLMSNERSLSPLYPPIPNAADSSNTPPPAQPFELFFVESRPRPCLERRRIRQTHFDDASRIVHGRPPGVVFRARVQAFDVRELHLSLCVQTRPHFVP